jgi:helicase required for RNAi-mediated heterochromatin assembly 1
LKSLQRLDKETFPMEEYFIQIQREDYPPDYLQEYEEEGEVEIDIEDIRGRQLSMLPLFPHTWPSGSELGLDPSQYNALQAALTRELVVIQGPPGTGKTFMALKIAGILIENKAQMGRTTPILVVCLTNHALDQFLVGMLKFTQSIVRIGGQSKEERLDQFNLKNQHYRRNKQQYKQIQLINKSYKKLEQVEASLLVISNSARKGDVSKKELLEEERTSLIDTISSAKDRIEEIKNRDQVNFLKDVDVIGMTTNGAARLQKMLSALECEIGIIE